MKTRQTSLIATLILLLGLPPLLTGCGALVVGGVTVGAAMGYDRRGAQVVLDDEVIEFRARDAYLKDPEISKRSQLKVTSYNYHALITGTAETPEIRDRFAKMVAEVPNVVKVFDEAQIGPMISVGQLSKDTLLGSRAKLAIQSIDLPNFDALRVKVVVFDSVVYLMGLVSPEEADATVDKVRRIPGVKRVVRAFQDIPESVAKQ